MAMVMLDVSSCVAQIAAYWLLDAFPLRGWLFLRTIAKLSSVLAFLRWLLPLYWFLSHFLCLLQLVVASVHLRNIFGVAAHWKRWLVLRCFTVAHVGVAVTFLLFNPVANFLSCLIVLNVSSACVDFLLVDSSEIPILTFADMMRLARGTDKQIDLSSGRVRPFEEERPSDLLGATWLELVSALRIPLVLLCSFYVALVCFRTPLFLMAIPILLAAFRDRKISPTSMEAIGIWSFPFFLLNWWKYSASCDFLSLQSCLLFLSLCSTMCTWRGLP
jgi:hypothetical protein